MVNANKLYCYRICHIKNIEHILKVGLCTKHHPDASPHFISIGNLDIISTRDDTRVKIPGYGKIGEYVPFYFTPRSIMLFNIITVYQAPEVPKRAKEEIMVIRCSIEQLSKVGRFFFTDGQANVISMTEHYNDLADLDVIDWQIIQNSDFKNDAGDNDKRRRYQAEFLVYNYIPAIFIESILVYNESAKRYIKKELEATGLTIPVNINKHYLFD